MIMSPFTVEAINVMIYSLLLLLSFAFIFKLRNMKQYLPPSSIWIEKIMKINFNPLIMLENIVLLQYSYFTRRIHIPKRETPKQFTPSISFMGGGQLWMFSIGVGHYIYEHYDISNIKFLSSSSGCFAAVPLACGLDPYDWCRRDWAKCIAHFNSRALGCLYDTKQFYFDLWNDYLPKDAHILCTDRLFISVTQYPSMKNRVRSKFANREELIWTIVASMCLPFLFIRDFPVMCGSDLGLCLDGGFSNDAPCLDSYTITVSALHREADIKPNMTASNVTPLQITAMDIIRVPTYSRVWEIGDWAQQCALLCEDFERHEWQSIKSDRIKGIVK